MTKGAPFNASRLMDGLGLNIQSNLICDKPDYK